MHNRPRFLSIFSGLILVLVGFLLGLSAAKTNIAIKLDSPRILRGGNDKEVATGDITSPKQAASIMIDTGRDILGFQKLPLQSGDTAFSLLTRLDDKQESLTVVSQNYKDLGVMIQSINGFKNGDNGRYWQYWVNNEYAQAAADRHRVLPGDVIMWKFTSSQFKEY